MPIDFSKITLSVLPKGGNVVKAPPKKGRIDYGAIKLSNIYTPSAVKTMPKPVAVPSTPFIGRPLVTPVEQQRMKAAAPTPPAVSRLTSGYNPQKYNPEVNPVAPLLQTAAVKRWSAEAALARKATPEIGQRLLDGMDSFTKIIQPNITPSDSGRNTVVDFAGSIASVAAGVYAVKSLLSALGAGVLYLKTPRSVVDRETTTLFPRFDDSFQAQKYVLKLQQTDPAAAEKFKSDLVTLLAQTMAKDMPTTLSDESLQETASRMYDFLVSNGQAGSFATVGERFASATTAASNLGAAVGNPQMSLAVATQATNQLAKTGMLQLLPPLVVANRLGTIPMLAGLVHSTAPAIPMGGKTLPALVASTPTPAQEVAPQETTNLITKPWPKAPASVTRPIQAPAVKSYTDIMAKEEAMGAALNTAPRAVDKTIPAIDITKANLVDVTAKVDLKTIQANLPTVNKVVVDTKRQTVMFMHDTTPLDAMGVDRPQLRDWYGIDGAKLLGEVTQPVSTSVEIPAPVVARVAPPLSKMGTPAVKEPWEMTREKFVSAEPKRAGTKGQAYQAGVQHSLSVKQALAEGKPVSPEVLADYPALTTTPQKGTATTISNQKTSISTSIPVSPRVGTQTGASEVKWGKWIDAVGSRRTSGVGTGQVDAIKTPVTYRLGSGDVSFRWRSNSDVGPWSTATGKALELKGDNHTLFIRTIVADNPKYNEYIVTEGRSGYAIGRASPTVKGAIANAQENVLKHKVELDATIDGAVAKNGEVANPVPTGLLTSTSVPVGAPAIGNATPAHGLIDYSKIELNGTTSVTSPAVLQSAGNTGKRSRVETEGFNNYAQNTAGTKDTSLSPFAKFKEGRDLNIRRIENQFDGLMKTPAGAEWMTMAIEADEVLREEYARPFYIDEAGERVYVEGEFAPAILNRYLKQYGPNFGKFLQHLQRAGISTEPTLGLSAEKEALKQKHIYDARMSLVNFQKNEPQLFTAYMTAANELGNANALLAEFYKGMISPETYANDKANPHYYVSLSAGKTDVFDRSGVAPLERTHGLTDLENVVPPLEGLKAVYVDAIRAQGINNAKKEAVKSNKNSEVATTELSDSIVHLKENGVDKAYDVHDTNVTQSVHNLTLKKPEVPTWEKSLVKSPTTSLRLFATGLNPAFGLFNIIRDFVQSIFTVPINLTGVVKGTIRAFKSPGLSQWFDSYRDPMMSRGAKAKDALGMILQAVTFPNEVGESLIRSITAETVVARGGTYLDQLHAYYASTGFFALHGTFFNDFIASNIPFTRATIAVVRSAYRNTFYGLPIGDKGGTFSGKQGAEKLAGRNLATIIFTIVSALAIKEAGKEKEYKLLRDRASYFYFPTPSGAWIKLPVPIGFQPIKAVTDSLFGYKSDPLSVARQTLNVLPGLESFMLPPALALFLQLKFNINFFTGAAIDAAVGTPAANPLEAGIMKATGWTEERTAFVVRAFLADIPSQVQYVFDMVGQGSSTQAFPASKRFIVKDPTTSSNAAVDDFYALVDAAGRSSNPALKHYVNARASAIGQLLHNAKAYPADAKVYMTTATDNIIATFATIAENPSDYGIKKFGPFSWRPKGNYEELAH